MEARTTLGRGVRPLQGGGGIFKSAAVAVLRMERRLMTTGEITKVALEKALINCQGRTPEATMASALYTDVKRKLDSSVFTRPQEGLFGLREWEEEGYVPEGSTLSETSTQSGPAAKRQRGASTRVAKRPERFVPGNSDSSSDAPALASPSPLLPFEHHPAFAASPRHSLQPQQDLEIHPVSFGMPNLYPRCSDATDASARSEGDAFVAAVDEFNSGDAASGNNDPSFVASPAAPAAQLDSRKRPFHEFELPPQAFLYAGFDFLDASPFEAPLSAAFDLPSIDDALELLSGSPLSSAVSSPEFQAHQMPTWPASPCAALRHIRPLADADNRCNLPPKQSDAACKFEATCLDTPSLMALPLPEGDLTWSPLCLPGQGELDDSTFPLLFPPLLLEGQPAAATMPDVPSEAEDLHELLQATLEPAVPTQIPASASAGQYIQGADKIASGMPPPQKGKAAAEKLAAMEAEVLREEGMLGSSHPMVGKHWLALSRAFQSEDPIVYADKAEQALVRAWRICIACFTADQDLARCNAPFDLLLSCIRSNKISSSPEAV